MLRIGIIGRGAIGSSIQEIALLHGNAIVSGILARSQTREHSSNVPVVFDMSSFIALGHDVVIECAGQAALTTLGPSILASGSVLVPASVGAFAQQGVLKAHLAASNGTTGRLRLASGAIGGLDALAAAARIGLDAVKYTGLMAGATAAGDAHPDAKERHLVFSGSARRAALTYPKHANLAVTIALVGLGLDATEVELYRDPIAEYNVHQLHAKGAFGELNVTSEGRRISPSSPSSKIVPASLYNAAIGSYHLELR